MSERRYRLRRLFRRGDSGAGARQVSARLISLVAESPSEAWLVLDTWCPVEDQEVFVTLRCHEFIDTDSLEWAFEDVADWDELTNGETLPQPQPGVWLHEVSPAALASARERQSIGFAPELVLDPPSVPWPMATNRPGDDVVRALGEQGEGTAIRWVLGAVSDEDCAPITDVVAKTWSRLSQDELLAYVGTPVRMSMYVSTPGPHVPARIRTVLRAGRRELDIDPVGMFEEASVGAAWESVRPDSVIPAGCAQAMLLAPAASAEPLMGVATADQPTQVHPLMEDLREPAVPIRLGSAKAVTGPARDVRLDSSDLLRHLQILGQTGTGKSTLLAALMEEIAASGAGCVLLDPHGTTVDRVLAEASSESAKRMLVTRFGDLDRPVPVNPLGASDEADFERAVGTFLELLYEIFDPTRMGIIGPRFERWFALIARAARALLGNRANLAAMQAIAVDVDSMKLAASRIQGREPEVARSILTEFCTSTTDRGETIGWTNAKFQRLLGSPHLRGILQTGADALDFAQRLHERSIVLVDLAMPTLGVAQARTVGTMVLEQLWTATLRRPDRNRPFFVLADEAHLFAHGPLPRILAEGRKFGLGAVIATQHQSQLSRELLGSLTANSASLVAFRSALQDASDLAARLGGWSITELTRLPKLQAAASLSVDGVPTTAFTLKVDHNERLAQRSRNAFVEEVERRSNELLVKPFRGGPALDPRTLRARVPADPALPSASLPLAPAHSSRTPTQPDFIDRWLDERDGHIDAITKRGHTKQG